MMVYETEGRRTQASEVPYDSEHFFVPYLNHWSICKICKICSYGILNISSCTNIQHYKGRFLTNRNNSH